MAFDLSNVVNKSSAQRAINFGQSVKKVEASKPVTKVINTVSSAITSIIPGFNLIVPKKLQEKIAPAVVSTTGTVGGGAVGFATAGPAGIIPGAVIGSTVAGVPSIISLLEKNPTSATSVAVAEKLGYSSIEAVEKAVAEHPIEAITLAATAPVVVALGLKGAGAATRGTASYVATKSSLSNLDNQISSITNPTDVIGIKDKKLIETPIDKKEEKEIPKTTTQYAPETAQITALQPDGTNKATVPEGYDVPVLAKDEKHVKRRKNKPIQPIRVYNRVDVINRNLFKLTTL